MVVAAAEAASVLFRQARPCRPDQHHHGRLRGTGKGLLPLHPRSVRLPHEGRCIFIVNTARGDLVASAALAKALCSGKIAGAGLDTIAPEPVTTENPLLSLPHDRRGDPGGAKRTAAGKYRERVIIKSKTKTPLQLKWKSCEGVFACTATAHMGGCYCLFLAGGSGFMASSAMPSSFG